MSFNALQPLGKKDQQRPGMITRSVAPMLEVDAEFQICNEPQPILRALQRADVEPNWIDEDESAESSDQGEQLAEIPAAFANELPTPCHDMNRPPGWGATLVALGASLAIHGTALAAGFVILRLFSASIPPDIRFGAGDGASESGLVDRLGNSDQTPGAASLSLPAPIFSREAADQSPSASSVAPAGSDDPEPDVLPPLVQQAIDLPASEQDEDPARVAPALVEQDLLGPDSLPNIHRKLPLPQQPTAGSAGSETDLTGSQTAAGATETSANPSNSTPAQTSASAAAATEHVAFSPSAGGGGATSGEGGQAGSGQLGIPAGIRDRLPRPIYPINSRRRGEQGTVVLEVEILPSGNVGFVHVLADAGYPDLAEAAVDAFRGQHFPPATENGRPVRSVVRVPFRFSLRS